MSNGTQSIDRALSVLNAFDDHNPILSLTELVEHLDLNKTTVFRILTALEQAGYVEKTEAGDYRLGSQAIALGGRASRSHPLRVVSNKHLDHLSDLTGETVTLEIARQDNNANAVMLVIDEVLGKHLVGITQYIGTQLPIHATSTGKVILAHLAPEDRATLISYPLTSLTNKTVTSQNQFEAELAMIHKQGYALASGELEEGLVAIGAPIFDHNRLVIAALSIVGPSVRLTMDIAQNLVPAVCSVAADISYDLGFRE
jgi:IclR family acetate operon transcriptional repressor